MLRPHADPDESGRNAPENWKLRQHSQRERKREPIRAAQHSADDPILNDELQSLCDPGRPLAPALDAAQRFSRQPTLTKRCAQEIRRGDRVLNCKIDPDSTNRRHSVRHRRYTAGPAETIREGDRL